MVAAQHRGHLLWRGKAQSDVTGSRTVLPEQATVKKLEEAAWGFPGDLLVWFDVFKELHGRG